MSSLEEEEEVGSESEATSASGSGSGNGSAVFDDGYGVASDSDPDLDDDSSSYSDSSEGDKSLGDLIASMGGVAALSKAKMPAGAMLKPPNLKRGTSMPNILMRLEADVEPDSIGNEQQREALERFMDRMNNAEDAYFQVPGEQRPASTRTRPRKSNSTGAIEDIKKDSVDLANPVNFYKNLLKEILPENTEIGDVFSETYWQSFFLPITEKRRNAYKADVVKAIRDQDLDTLKTILAAEGDASMEACNAQGETLLHLACRRRNHALVKFLVITAHVSIQVRDDFGKTPLHEVAWYTEPRNHSQFESIEFLMVLAPEMFFAKDKRGFTPLQYAPKSCWKDWCRFLSRHKESIRSKVQKMNFS